MTPNYTTRSFTVPANGSSEIYREASFLTCLKASAAFKLKIDGGAQFDFEAGLGLTPDQPFTRLEFINPTDQPITVKIGLGKGGVRDARLVISDTLDTKGETPPNFDTGAPVNAPSNATTLLAAENLQRRELILVNDGENKVYVASSPAAAAGQGVPMEAGGTLVLTTTAAAYVRNDSGAAVSVSVAQIGWA